MKTLFFILAFVATTATAFARTSGVNEKVLKQFQETFKDAKEVVWKEYDAFYEVDFKLSTSQMTVRYDADGNVLRYLRYYSGNQLPTLILLKLKNQYPGRTVFGITEFFNDNELNYLVTMKDDKHWYTVKSDTQGNLQQTEKFNRGDK